MNNNFLQLEHLEDRIVPDGDPIMLPPPLPPEAVQVTLMMGTLTITGTSGIDDIKIERDETNFDNINVWANSVLKANFAANLLTFINVDLKGGNDKFLCENILSNPINGFQGMWVTAGAGDDEVDVNIGSTIDGGDGNDTLLGSDAADVIWGGNGNDTIKSQGGADIVSGGADNDVIRAGSGNDLVWGDAGNDTISGGTGADKLYGGDGNDELAGNYMQGEIGGVLFVAVPELSANEVYGGEGNDKLYSDGVISASYYSGDNGDDIIYGQNLNDAAMIGGFGNDVIYSNLTEGSVNYIHTDDGDVDAISTHGNDLIDDDIFDVYF